MATTPIIHPEDIIIPVTLPGGLPQDTAALESIFPEANPSGNKKLNIGAVLCRWPLNAESPTSYRELYHDEWFDLTFTYQRRGGYSNFSFMAKPAVADSILQDDVIFVYSGADIIYSGRVELVNVAEGNPVNYSVAGTESILSLKTLERSFGPFDSPVSAHWCLTKLVEKLQKAYPYMLTTIVGAGDFADTMYSINCEGQTFWQAFDALADSVETPIVWGIRFDSSVMKWEFYFLSLSVADTLQVSKGDCISYTEEFDTTQLFTEVLFRGNDAKYPQLMTNWDFETGKVNSKNVMFNEMNLLDASFETGGYGWSLGSGTSIKTTGDDGGTVEARTGTKVLEIDRAGEFAGYIFHRPVGTPAGFPVNPASWYHFGFWYRPEVNADISDPPVIKCEIKWLNSGNTVISTDTFYTDPQTIKAWFHISANFQAPANSVKIEILLTGHTTTVWGDQKGIHIDDFQVILKDMVYPDSWQIEPVLGAGTSQVEYYSFIQPDPHNGFFYLKVKATVTGSSATNYVKIYNLATQNITAGMQVKMSARIRSFTGQTWPDLRFVAEFYKPDTVTTNPPVLISTFSSNIHISAPTPGVWTYTSTQFAAPNETTFAICYLAIETTGTVGIDCFSLRDAQETASDEFGNRVEILRNAATVVPVAPYSSAETSYGVRRKVLEGDADNVADAEKAVIRWLKSNIRFTKSPRIEDTIKIREDLPDIRKKIRVIEYDVTFPVESVDVRVGEHLMKMSSLQFRTPDITDILNNIKERGSKIL